MKKRVFRRMLTLAMAVFMAAAPVCSNLGMISHAEDVRHVWKAVDPGEVSSEDKIAIAVSAGDSLYVLPSGKTSKNPAAVMADLKDNELTIPEGSDSDYAFNITRESEKTDSVDGSASAQYFSIKSGNDSLFLAANNNGVKIGDPGKNLSGSRFTIESGYLSAIDSENSRRYLGVYKDKGDWRCYKGTTENIAGQSVSFYKLTDTLSSDKADDTKVSKKVSPVLSSLPQGKVKKGTKVSLSSDTENATVYYNTNGSNNYSPFDKNHPLVINEDTAIYAYASLDGYDNSDRVMFSYTVDKEEKNEDKSADDSSKGKLLTRELYDGDQLVICYPKDKEILTGETIKNKKNLLLLGSSPIKLSDDGTIDTSGTKALRLTAIDKGNGLFSFRNSDGKFLTADKTGLYFGDETAESLWNVEKAGKSDGSYYIVNENYKFGSKKQYLEYWSGFSTYSYNKNNDSNYVFNFYLLKDGKKKAVTEYDKDTELDVAKWSGQWGNSIGASIDGKSVDGDIYATNDMLDKTAKYRAVVSGNEVTPYTIGKSAGQSAGQTYYMGGSGVGSGTNDYMEFALSSRGYADMKMSFRLRVSNGAPESFQLQYSKDGKNFNNFTKGTYSYSYTDYSNNKQTPVSKKGEIKDGKAVGAFCPGKYVNFSFDLPEEADNADNLLIRFIPSDKSAMASKTGSRVIGKGSTVRIDTVSIKGHPITASDLTGFVKAEPLSGEIGTNDAVTLTSATEGADIYFSLNNGAYEKYDPAKKISFSSLPATIRTYAVKEGLKDSIRTVYSYSQSKVASVKATPNGGAVAKGQKLTLRCDTEGATILYAFRDQSDKSDDYSNVSWNTYKEPISLDEPSSDVLVKAVKAGYIDSPVQTLKFTKRSNDKYNIYFGQVHAHTNISDGSGDIEEAYRHASKVDNLDFIAVTDHSNSIDNADTSDINKNVDTSADQEWTKAHRVAREYSNDKFTSIYGYEMTWSNGLGHINTYNTKGFQSRTQTEYSTYSTALQNYYKALRSAPDSISQFNHPGTTFGDFSDFSYYSEENDSLITMIEVGNGEGTIGSSGYFPSYEYYTRALDKGWHLAPTNNQDNHKGKWGDANTARTVMLADSNNEEAIYDAMRNYRIYATEDNNLSVYYTLDGYIMGSILQKDQVGDNLNLSVDIHDANKNDAIGKVEVIVNGGQSIAQKTVDTNAEKVEFTVPSAYSYYYIKITEADGDIAVTAPVWVGKVEACGINKTYTNSVLPVSGEPYDINVNLYNNEKSSLVINDINITLKDVDGNSLEVVNKSGVDAGVPEVSSNSEALFKTDFVYNSPGKVTYNVTVHATLDGVPKTYTDKLSADYVVPGMVTNVIVDGTHYNDYVTGYYGGNMGEFTKICGKSNIKVNVEKNKITPEMLKNCNLLIISAPAKKSGTANAGDYKVSHFDKEFLDTVAQYVKDGGSVIVCGLADYSDSRDGQTATEQNKLLSAIGSTLRLNSDEVMDDKNNGGQAYRLYPTNFNMKSSFLKNVVKGQKYSQYSGCSVDVSDKKGNDFVSVPVSLVKGFDTTYSKDCKDSSGKTVDKVNDNKGNVTFLAAQKTSAGGNIFAAGGVFMSDFEVKAEIDNNASLPYANYNIINNIVNDLKTELPVSTIKEARNGKMNDVFSVEGYVTSGTENKNTTFFDTIYIQDETGGIDIFPYSESGLAIGTRVKVTGFVSQYQGDKELKVISVEKLDDKPYIYPAKELDNASAMDYETYGGSLIRTRGKVKRVDYAADGKTVAEFWLDDGSGKEAAIFIDGYINSLKTGKNTIGDFVKPGALVSAAGILYMHPEGNSDVSLPVLRVRNTDDIYLEGNAADEKNVIDNGQVSPDKDSHISKFLKADRVSPSSFKAAASAAKANKMPASGKASKSALTDSASTISVSNETETGTASDTAASEIVSEDKAGDSSDLSSGSQSEEKTVKSQKSSINPVPVVVGVVAAGGAVAAISIAGGAAAAGAAGAAGAGSAGAGSGGKIAAFIRKLFKGLFRK